MDLSEKDGASVFAIRVVPRASRTEIVGPLDGALKVRIASPPVDGAANAELIKFLAKRLGVPRNDIQITSGETSRNKTIRVANLSASKFREQIK